MERIAKIIRSLLTKLRGIGLARLGWYGALAALLVALGSASYAYRNRGSVQNPTEAAPQAVLAVHTPDPLEVLVALPEPTPAPTPEPLRFVWPVEGEIIGEYAEDYMVYNPGLAQWQTHPALDIAAAAGEVVCACADGVVADAWEDGLWGNVIQITHPEGYTSTYANLNTLKLVRIGDSVAAGQTISAVGRTAVCEYEQPWHLHFRLEQDGKPVDLRGIMGEARGET